LVYPLPLLDDSPAIDAGTVVNVPTTDQRGATRPQRVAGDIGGNDPLPFGGATDQRTVDRLVAGLCGESTG